MIGPCHIRRIEGGISAFGADMWYENNPFEVGYHYTWMVDLEQEADFMGKEALKKIKAEGVKQKLVGVDIEGEPLGTYIDNEMLDFFPASAGGSVVGRVTSACYSPRMEKNIGLAMLPIEHTELGTSLEVETPKGKVGATVVQIPHWDPTKEIPEGLGAPSGWTPGAPGSPMPLCSPFPGASRWTLAMEMLRRAARVRISIRRRASRSRRLLRRPLFELIPLRDALARAEALPAGAATTVTASPSHGIEATRGSLRGVDRAGTRCDATSRGAHVPGPSPPRRAPRPMPPAGIRSAFVVGGDAKDRGEFHDGLALIRAMEELGNPFTSIGVARLPGGTPDDPSNALTASLLAKQEHADHVTTQMTFDPRCDRLVDRHGCRDAGMTLPVHVGLAGAATFGQLRSGRAPGSASAVRCAICGNTGACSSSSSARIVRTPTAPPIPRADAGRSRAERPGLHLFTFNQVEETVAWQQRLLEELS